MTNVTVRRCCKKPIKLIIVYESNQIISICQEHSEKFEYRRSIKWIIDYQTKKDLTPEEAFGKPKSEV